MLVWGFFPLLFFQVMDYFLRPSMKNPFHGSTVKEEFKPQRSVREEMQRWGRQQCWRRLVTVQGEALEMNSPRVPARPLLPWAKECVISSSLSAAWTCSTWLRSGKVLFKWKTAYSGNYPAFEIKEMQLNVSCCIWKTENAAFLGEGNFCKVPLHSASCMLINLSCSVFNTGD